MPEEKKYIPDIQDETVEAIKRKTAYALPDSPAQKGLRANTVKPHFYQFITDEDNSVISLLKMIIAAANDVFSLMDETDAVLKTFVQEKFAEINAALEKKCNHADGLTSVVHATNSRGNECFLPYSQKAVSGSVVSRSGEGYFYVKTPTEYSHPAPKGYVDNKYGSAIDYIDQAVATVKNEMENGGTSGVDTEALENKLDKSDVQGSLYSVNPLGEQSNILYAATVMASRYTIPMRDAATQTFEVGDPQTDQHPVTLGSLKKHVKQSDWNESDENSQSFVKNRTHYVKEWSEEHVAPFNGSMPEHLYSVTMGDVTVVVTDGLNEGNEGPYEWSIQKDADVYIGALYDGEYPITFHYRQVKQLDPEFIPDSAFDKIPADTILGQLTYGGIVTEKEDADFAIVLISDRMLPLFPGSVDPADWYFTIKTGETAVSSAKMIAAPTEMESAEIPQGFYFLNNVSGLVCNGVSYEKGDWILVTNKTYGKVDNTDAVMSVNGQMGVVSLDASDVGAYDKAQTDAKIDLTEQAAKKYTDENMSTVDAKIEAKVAEELGDVNAAIDEIIAVQEELIGGGA